MKKLSKLLISFVLHQVFFLNSQSFAQYPEPKINTSDPALPQWVKMMYDESQSVYAIDSAYENYFQTHPFKESVYTRWYMRWRRYVSSMIDDKGLVHFPTTEEINQQLEKRKSIQPSVRSTWAFTGPDIHYTHKNSENDIFESISEHANIYSVDRSLSNSNILFAGSETGGVFKSADAGENWSMVTFDMLIFDVKCVKIHPTNEDIVLFGAAGKIYKTTDGGLTWNITGDANFQSQSTYTWDIFFNPANPNMVYAATNYGLYRSLDGGNNWTKIFSGQSMSVMVKPDDASVVYTLQYDASQKIPYLYKSIDSGATFTKKSQGWFQVPAEDLGKIQSDGGRIAVSLANPNRVYVLLVGTSQSNANLQLGGFIGTYVSDDAGETWSLPQGYLGAPYNVNTAPCLMDFDGHSADYNQIYYNTYIAASQLDADRILIGGLNMWRSDDAAATYQTVGGYIGDLALMHVDEQSIKVYKTSDTTEEVWWSSDGGINHSTDFLATHKSKCRGIYATELWGFDQGWNEDIMVGGRYHNGNMGHAEGFPQGEFLSLGGGEAATGYTNYSDERKSFFSDIGSVVLPTQIDGITKYTGASGQPNESYWEGESSRIIFDWNNYHIAYMGKENKLYRSTDGGSNFSELHAFGSASQKVIWIDQSRANTNVMYVQQFVGSKSLFWKTADGGTTWNQITLPLANQKLLEFTLSEYNADELWISFHNAPNGQKIFHTTDGGATWINISTAMLDDLNIWSITHQFGTNGGVYAAVKQGIVFYRNNLMSDWEVVGSGLPAVSEPLRIVPFYKQQKIRLATWHAGIWETDFYEPSNLVADFGIGNHTIYCAGDTIYFSDHSVATFNATYQWNISGAFPSSSTQKNPHVVYDTPGEYDVTLIVSDNGASDTITKTITIDGVNVETLPIAESFESGLFNPDWLLTQWAISTTIGGYGNSTHSMYFDNYDSDLQGAFVDVQTAKYNFTTLPDAKLTFDIAYAPYGNPYYDSLAVLVSTDCGSTFTKLYQRGGCDLATKEPCEWSDYFYPENDEWRTDTVLLNDFVGFPEVVIAFRNIGYYGNLLWVDNINLTSPTGIAIPNKNIAMEIFPNPNDGRFLLKGNFGNESEMKITIMNSVGQIVLEKNYESSAAYFSKAIDIRNFGKGIYLLRVEMREEVSFRSVVVD